MAWFKIDDNFYDHPKVDELSLEAIGLWAVCGTYVARHLTDGFIPARRVTRLGGTDEIAAELVDAELWDPADGGYTFRNWHEYQPTRAEVEGKKEQARRRQQRKRQRDAEGRYVKEGKTVTSMSRVTNAVSHAPVTEPVTPSPVTPVTGHGENPGSTAEGSTQGGQNVTEAAQSAENGAPEHNQPELLEIDDTEGYVTPPVTRDKQRDSRVSNAVSHTCPDPSRPDPTSNTPSLHAASGGNGEKVTPAEPEFSPEVTGLAEYLAGWIVKNGNRKPRVTKTWLQAIDRLMRIDGFSPDEIRQVIDWSQSDEFWQGNILSAPKLRKQFDQLRHRMTQDRRRSQPRMAPGSERALNTLQLGQQLQAQYENAHNSPREIY